MKKIDSLKIFSQLTSFNEKYDFPESEENKTSAGYQFAKIIDNTDYKLLYQGGNASLFN